MGVPNTKNVPPQGFRRDREQRNYQEKPRNERREESLQRDIQNEDKNKSESISWDDYFKVNATSKIHSISEVKFPFNFKGMKDFVPIVIF